MVRLARLCMVLLAVLLSPIVASAAAPPPVPQPGPPTKMFTFAITSVQTGFMFYTWSPTIGPVERWLITGTVSPGIPGGGCHVKAIIDGNISGYVEFPGIAFLDMATCDHYDFGIQVDIPAGTWTIVTVVAENDYLEVDREYVQLPPNLASAPNPAWPN